MNMCVGEEEVVFVHADGQRHKGRIGVAAPVEDKRGGCSCSVAYDGIGLGSGLNVYGGSSLQALLLALRFLGSVLHSFISKGGRVRYPDADEDVPLDALFGEYFRAPDPPKG